MSGAHKTDRMMATSGTTNDGHDDHAERNNQLDDDYGRQQ